MFNYEKDKVTSLNFLYELKGIIKGILGRTASQFFNKYFYLLLVRNNGCLNPIP